MCSDKIVTGNRNPDPPTHSFDVAGEDKIKRRISRSILESQFESHAILRYSAHAAVRRRGCVTLLDTLSLVFLLFPRLQRTGSTVVPTVRLVRRLLEYDSTVVAIYYEATSQELLLDYCTAANLRNHHRSLPDDTVTIHLMSLSSIAVMAVEDEIKKVSRQLMIQLD